MLSLCLVAMVTPLSDIVLDALQRSHEITPIGSFTAHSLHHDITQTTARYEVAYRWPNEYRIKKFVKDTSKLSRDIAIEPNRIVNFDAVLQQYTVDRRETGETVGEIVTNLEEGLDDLLLAFVDKAGMGVWIDELRAVSNWTTTSDAKNVFLNHEGSDVTIQIDIDRKRFQITRFDTSIVLQRLEWKISYDSSPKSTRFKAPRGSYKVPVFDRETRLPTYADSKARIVTQKVFDAYTDLTSIGYEVERESGITKVFMRSDFVRQDDPVASWTFDGDTLSYYQKQTNTWYRGSATFVQVIDAVGNLGTRVDPTVMLLMRGFNPYRRRLGDGAHVRTMGSIEMEEGVMVTILNAESDNANITLYVRDSDGMVVSTIIRGKDANMNPGNVELKFNYFNVPRNVATEQRLVAPTGTTFRSVQRILTTKD